MDFTSIKHGLTGSIRRFPTRRRVSTTGVLRRAIEPRFADWIRGHWQFLEGRLFNAVPLSFQRPAKPFGQISWPQSNEISSSVVMAPRIQLNLRLTPVTNMFFEGNTSNSSFSELSENAASRFVRIGLTNNSYSQSFFQTAMFPRTMVSSELLTREYWSNFFQFNNRLRESSGQPGAMTFQTAERFAEQLTKIFQSQRVTTSSKAATSSKTTTFSKATTSSRTTTSSKTATFLNTTTSSKTTDRPLLTTISSAVREFTHSLKSNLVQYIIERQEAREVRDRREPGTEKASRAWSGTTFSLTRVLKSGIGFHANSVDSFELNKLNENVTSSTHSFLALLHNSKFSGGPMPTAHSIPDVSRQFAVSRSSGPDAMAQQIQYFGPPTNLSYVKRESPELQQLVSTLKEARTAQPQVKTPAPEFPSVAQLTTHVRQELERELRIERERRGL